MEFGWTPEQQALRDRLGAFLADTLPADWDETAALSPGSEAVTSFSMDFCPKLNEAGLLVPHWPEEFGGQGASAWEHFILGEMLWEAGEPRGPQYYNVNWIGRAIMEYGSPEQKAYHLGRMRGALEHTVQYVKDRQQFGHALGHFQAIQHRLAEDMQLARACRALAFRAAWSDSDREAATACLYAQEAMRKVINDCHQFCGAMGLTLEFPLHCWTYRMKVLQGEAGGKTAQDRIVVQAVWPGQVERSANDG